MHKIVMIQANLIPIRVTMLKIVWNMEVEMFKVMLLKILFVLVLMNRAVSIMIPLWLLIRLEILIMIGSRGLLVWVHNNSKLVLYHLLLIKGKKFLVSFCLRIQLKKVQLCGEDMILINMQNKEAQKRILNGLI